MAKRKKTFEESLEELEQVVEKIESGDLPLDKCLDEYEKGIKLADFCARELDAAEKRIEKLKKTKTGEYVTVPLDDEESGQSDTGDSEESEEE
jgi:exodeoxyribonuclease VII small subunit